MTRPVKLYATGGSVCSVKARAALLEKGVEFTERLVNIGPANEHFQPWYVRLNPKIVVPTLDDNGTIVCDSAVIIRYIDENFDGPILGGQDEQEREAVAAWVKRIDQLDVRGYSMSSLLGGRMKYIVANVMGPYRIRQARKLKAQHPELAGAYQSKIEDYESLVHKMSTPTEVAATKAEVHACLAELDSSLTDGFLVGENYSFADLMATGLIARIKLCNGFDETQYPALSKHYARMKSRPSFTLGQFGETADRKMMFRVMAPFVLPRLAAVVAMVVAMGVGLVWLVW